LQDPRAKGLSLTSLLITPIQRVPRVRSVFRFSGARSHHLTGAASWLQYKLLLQDLLKNTLPNHPDRKTLEKAFALVCQAAIGEQFQFAARLWARR
jgi:hypothetical protein